MFQLWEEKRKKKKFVVNDPSGQIHSPTNSNHYFHATFVCFAIFRKVRTDARTETCAKIMITTARDYGSTEWIKRKVCQELESDCVLAVKDMVVFWAGSEKRLLLDE